MVDYFAGEVYYVAGQEHVDQGGGAHAFSGYDQVQDQQEGAQDHVIGAEGYGFFEEVAPDALGEALERVYAEAGAFEEAYGYGAEDDACCCHQNALFKVFWIFHCFFLHK